MNWFVTIHCKFQIKTVFAIQKTALWKNLIHFLIISQKNTVYCHVNLRWATFTNVFDYLLDFYAYSVLISCFYMIIFLLEFLIEYTNKKESWNIIIVSRNLFSYSSNSTAQIHMTVRYTAIFKVVNTSILFIIEHEKCVKDFDERRLSWCFQKRS